MRHVDAARKGAQEWPGKPIGRRGRGDQRDRHGFDQTVSRTRPGHQRRVKRSIHQAYANGRAGGDRGSGLPCSCHHGAIPEHQQRRLHTSLERRRRFHAGILHPFLSHPAQRGGHVGQARGHALRTVFPFAGRPRRPIAPNREQSGGLAHRHGDGHGEQPDRERRNAARSPEGRQQPRRSDARDERDRQHRPSRRLLPEGAGNDGSARRSDPTQRPSIGALGAG